MVTMPQFAIHDNDGHVDDFLSTILLWLSPELSLLAVTVTDGDCFAAQSYEAFLKMATFLDVNGGEIGYSEDPCPNPFPDSWRRESYIINELPIFSDNALKTPYQTRKARKSSVIITECLNNSRGPVTLVCTGPLTNIAPIFEERPELKKKVESIVFMGGAFGVQGNVEMPEHDNTAEWNVYADPQAAKRVLDSGIPITFIPLDVTNHVPVTREFILKLDEQAESCRASQLAAKLYSLVKGFNYYFWDTLTAAAVIKPELFTFKDQRVDIVTQGKSQGRTQATIFGGKKVKIATSIKVEPFEQFILEVLRRR
ncbi:MAG: nucleoside hydrolase [Candidatus Obscuribacterales bacterium]|nr:nucleoside hydrolase [Candidatus Obscuribacterales bacterium]